MNVKTSHLLLYSITFRTVTLSPLDLYYHKWVIMMYLIAPTDQHGNSIYYGNRPPQQQHQEFQVKWKTLYTKRKRRKLFKKCISYMYLFTHWYQKQASVTTKTIRSVKFSIECELSKENWLKTLHKAQCWSFTHNCICWPSEVVNGRARYWDSWPYEVVNGRARYLRQAVKSVNTFINSWTFKQAST